MNFYICSTPYHLFVALIDTVIRKQKSYLYLSTPDKNVYELFIKYKLNILKIDNIEGVYIRKRNNIKEKLFIESVKDIIEYKKIKKYIDQGDVIIFPWNPYSLYTPAEYIFKKAKNVILMEDGSSSYLKEEPSRALLAIKKYIYLRNIKFYNDKKIKNVYVQFPEKYPKYFKYKLERLEIEKMIKSLKQDEKVDIINVFNDNLVLDGNENYKDSVIILTQPLSEDGYINEIEKKKLYKDIIKQYKNYNIVLKKHPRENTMYNIENVIELEGNFPSELFKLIDIKFEKAIGLCTSAINLIDAKERINLDEDFLKKLKIKNK